MDQKALEAALAGLALGRVGYFEMVGSTNDVTAEWAEEEGCADLSLAVADEQTEGRGRSGRKWFTPRGAALAFSVVMRPNPKESEGLPRYVGLGAVAVAEALEEQYGLAPEIKWPNDILLGGEKACGILAETHWVGDQPSATILGIGVNVTAGSVPPEEMLGFPATCVEAVYGASIDRASLLRGILEKLIAWRARLASQEMMEAWERRLAYRGEWVEALGGKNQPIEGRLIGLDDRGQLRLRSSSGVEITFQAGEIRLRRRVDR